MSALWTARDIAAATQGRATGTWSASGVSIDSRTVAKGDVFIALKGPTHDGHDHVETSIRAGASGSLVHRDASTFSASLHHNLVVVKDTFTALHDLGRAARQRSNAVVTAVTGSVGKTGTKEALKLALSALGDTHATSGNLNNHWGVPLSLARMPRETRYGVFEIGMNHPGEVAPLSKLVAPHITIVTTVAAVHLEFFDSVAGIADEKASIAAGLTADGTAVLPSDSEYFDRLVKESKRYGCKNIVSFGADGNSNARLVSVALNPSGMQVAADILGQRVMFDMGVTGRQWAISALAVLAAVKTAGGDIHESAAALSRLAPTKGRGLRTQIKIAGGTATVIDESYNASPASVKALAETLGQIKATTRARTVLILGDMLELGADGPSLHAELRDAILANGIDVVHTAGPLMNHLHRELPVATRGIHAVDAAALAQAVIAEIKPGDLIGVKGSNGSRTSKVVDALLASSSAHAQSLVQHA